MGRKYTRRSVKLAGVIGPQSSSQVERVSLFTDNENEYPIVKDSKAAKLSQLIGQRVEIEGHLIYRWKDKELSLKVERYRLTEPDELDPMIRTIEPALPVWELMPAYA